jgi:hypothetical protein
MSKLHFSVQAALLKSPPRMRLYLMSFDCGIHLLRIQSDMRLRLRLRGFLRFLVRKNKNYSNSGVLLVGVASPSQHHVNPSSSC